MLYPISLCSFACAKAVGRHIHQSIKPTHLVEILAAGLGFKTHASLRHAIGDDVVELEWDDRSAARRAADIGSPPLLSSFPDHAIVRGLGVLNDLDSWSIERIADMAERADRDRTALGLARGGNMSEIVACEMALRGRGEWPSAARRDLDVAIKVLSRGELCELIAMMWLAREEYSREWQWDPLLNHAKRNHGNDSVDYVLTKRSLGQELRLGLEMISGRLAGLNKAA